jgi:branched-subunit amino acid transport protein
VADAMSLWIAVISVALLNAAIKGSGPAILGQRGIPPVARRLVGVLPAVVLTALVVSDVAGARWVHFDWQLAIGVGAAGTARLFKAPLLPAMLIAVAVTASLRAIALWRRPAGHDENGGCEDDDRADLRGMPEGERWCPQRSG